MPDDVSTAETAEAPKRRRRFRWRVLLIVPLAAGVLLAVYGPRQYRQRSALASLKERGAIVRSEPVAMPLIELVAGKEYSQEITEVYWRDPGVSDDDLRLLKGLRSLRKLELAGSNVSGEGLEHIAGLSGLYILHLADTKVTDDGLAHLGGLDDLGVLSLNGTRITDSGLGHLSELPRLERLFLDGTKITDEGMRHLAGLTALKELSLNETGITDAGLRELTALTNLEILKLGRTRVTKAAIGDFIRDVPKCHVFDPFEEDPM